MFDRKKRIALICALLIAATPAVVSASEYDVTTGQTIDVVDRQESFEGNSYNITAVTQVDPEDQVTVEVEAPSDKRPTVNLLNKERRIVYSYQDDDPGPTEFQIDVGEYVDSGPGTYALVVQVENDIKSVHPLVVRGYSVSADTPESVTSGEDIEINGEFSQLGDKTYNTIEVVVAAANSDQDPINKTVKIDGTTFSATVSTDELATGSYDVYAVIRGEDSVLGRQKEILGLSSPQLLDIESEETDTAESSSSSSSGSSSGGSAPADTTEDSESETSEPPAQASLVDGPVTRSVADADPDAGGVNVEVNAGPVGQVSFDAPSDAATGEMTVSQSTATTDTFASQFGQDRVKTAVSIEVPAELADTTASVQFQLSDEDLGDTAVDDLQVVKNTAGGSQVLSSSTATENGSVIITARTPGFSEFAVIEAPSETSTPTNEEESAAETTADDGGSDASGGEESDDSADESTDTNTPGFGPLVALIALLAVALSARYKR